MKVMKQVLLVALCVLFLLLPQLSFSQDLARDKSGDALKKAEEELIKAEVSGDQEVIARLLTDNYTHTLWYGRIESKTDYMKGFKPRRYQVVDLSDERVSYYGTSAVIVGQAQITSLADGAVGPVGYVFFGTWIEEKGEWRCAGWVSTRIQKRPIHPTVGNN
jgi:hypothetical protein